MAWADQISNLQGWAKWVDTGVEKNHGVSVVLYNQKFDIRTKVGGSLVDEGWCLAMSIQWIIKTARGESFWDWFHPPVQACPNLKDKKQGAATGAVFTVLKELMRMEGQKTELAKKVPVNQLTPALVMKANSWFCPKILSDSPALRKASADGYTLSALNGDAVCDLLLVAPGYKLLGASGPGGGHAMAVRVVDGTVVFMDPNCGELFFPSFADFRAFMNPFWKKKYTKLSAFVHVVAFTDPEVIKYG